MSSKCQTPHGRTVMDWLTPTRFGVLLAVALAICFPRALLGTHSFYYRDYGALGYPFIHYARESFWRGEMPFWNPLSNCGVPFLAQWGTMSLYPLSLFYLVLPLPWSLSVFCLAHLGLAGMGMYRLAERWTGNRLAAGLAGAAFVFNGFTLSCLIWPNYTVALGWMPWVVLTTEQAWRKGGGRIVLAALVATLQMLCGVPEIILLTWLAVGVLWIAGLWSGRQPAAASAQDKMSEVEPEAGAKFVRLVAVVCLTAGLSAVQLLPFFDLLAHSHREAGALTSKWAMPVWGWANLIVPLFHCFETPQGHVFQPGQEFIGSYYLGIGVLGLAIWGTVRGTRGTAQWLAALALFGLIMALGDRTPLYRWLGDMVPVAGLVRYPVKYVALTAFALPLLAAMGLASWLDQVMDRGAWKTLVGLGSGILIAMAGLLWVAYAFPMPYDRWSMTFWNTVARAALLLTLFGLVWLVVWSEKRQVVLGRILCVLVPACIVLDAVSHQPRMNPTLPSIRFAIGVWQQAFEMPPPRFGESRLMTTRFAEDSMLYSTVKDASQEWMGKRLAEWSNLNLLDGIPKVPGSATLRLREQQEVQRALYLTTNHLMNGLLDFLGVSQITSPGEVVKWTSRTNYLPLVSAGQNPVFVAPTSSLEVLLFDEFDPRKVVFLPDAIAGQVRTRAATSARVISTNLRANRLEFEVEAADSAWVVIAQSYYHPWEARVNGETTPLWRANHAFQALEVPAGRSRVVVEYRDRHFQAGGGLAMATLLGCGLYLSRRLRRGPEISGRQPTPPPEHETA